jgi:hypothetical protein
LGRIFVIYLVDFYRFTLALIEDSLDNDSDNKMTRGSLLAKLALAPIAIGALALLRTEEAQAAASMEPKAAGYVTHAVGGKKCSGCSLFIPAKTNPAKSAGACQIVKGKILPTAYCNLYAPKS